MFMAIVKSPVTWLIAFVLSCSITTVLALRIHKMMQEDAFKNAVIATYKREHKDLFDIQKTMSVRYPWMSVYEAEFYAYWFRKWAQMSGCDWYLFAAVARKESYFNPNAVSRKQARGVFQLMPDTFEDQCRRLGINSRRGQAIWIDVVNLVCGMDYMTQVKVKGDPSIEQMLRRYNCGSDSGRNVETDDFVIQVPTEMERLRYIYAGVKNE